MRYELGFWQGETLTIVAAYSRKRDAMRHATKLSRAGQACSVWDARERRPVGFCFAL